MANTPPWRLEAPLTRSLGFHDAGRKLYASRAPEASTSSRRASCAASTGRRNGQGSQLTRTRLVGLTTGTCRSGVARASGEEEVREVEMDAEDRMEKTLNSVKGELKTMRVGRASPSMLDRIQVDYFGSPTPLRTLAGISAPDASTLVVSPYDKTSMRDVERAIMTSDLGITPNNDGDRIRLNVPQLTEEKRKEMAKVVGKMGEDGKVALRNIRRDAIKSVEKLDLPEDAERALEEELQKLTDKYVQKVEKIVEDKEKELTTL